MKAVKRNFFIALIFIFSMLALIFASSLEADYTFLYDEEDALIQINPGWNLISIGAHENVKDYFPEIDQADICQFNNFKANYFYDSLTKEYLSEENIPEGYFSETEYRFKSILGSYWIYSGKKCFLILDSNIKDDKKFLDLAEGWNFLSITPSMAGKSLNQIKGNCQIIGGIYSWNSENKKWEEETDFSKEIGVRAIGQTFIMKVQEDCKLNFENSLGGEEVPSLPQ